jgi:hypothetical protein
MRKALSIAGLSTLLMIPPIAALNGVAWGAGDFLS